MRVRAGTAADAPRIAAIYNQGIAEGEATFETRPRTPAEVARRIESRRYPLLVAELDGSVVGWAALAPYSTRPAYAGVAECSVYVEREARGRGVGTCLLGKLAEEAEPLGFHKLLGKFFPTNLGSVRLVRRCGFRKVGVHRRHGRLAGRWRDVVLVEYLLGDPADGLHGL